jgi:hypothetical protein
VKEGVKQVVRAGAHDGELRRAEVGVTAVESTFYLAKTEQGVHGEDE